MVCSSVRLQLLLSSPTLKLFCMPCVARSCWVRAVREAAGVLLLYTRNPVPQLPAVQSQEAGSCQPGHISSYLSAKCQTHRMRHALLAELAGMLATEGTLLSVVLAIGMNTQSHLRPAW